MSYAKSDRIAYRASKAAVNKVMQGLATDLAPMGVAVALVLHPGWVRTDMGGPGADIDATESAGAILKTCRRANARQHGWSSTTGTDRLPNGDSELRLHSIRQQNG
jgi:NAD(P)-dependent dehydrogenase (short-subunit alcohol dehydrogenase family)